MKNVLPDLFLIGGLAALTRGVALISMGAGFIVGGIALIVLALAAAMPKAQ